MLDEKQKKDVFGTVKEQLPVFQTNQLCQSMGVYLERGARYLITFESTTSFRDGGIKAEKGFYSSEPDNPLQAAAMFAAIPLRRELMQPWFRIVARYGGQGGEETFLVPDPSDKYLINELIRATRDGELFLFVNDAVIGIPGSLWKILREQPGLHARRHPAALALIRPAARGRSCAPDCAPCCARAARRKIRRR